MKEPTFELAEAHRWFAASMNNQAWDLLESRGRSGDDDELMRNTAHASWRHWHEAGTGINRQWAEYLAARDAITEEDDRRVVDEWLSGQGSSGKS